MGLHSFQVFQAHLGTLRLACGRDRANEPCYSSQLIEIQHTASKLQDLFEHCYKADRLQDVPSLRQCWENQRKKAIRNAQKPQYRKHLCRAFSVFCFIFKRSERVLGLTTRWYVLATFESLMCITAILSIHISLFSCIFMQALAVFLGL